MLTMDFSDKPPGDPVINDVPTASQSKWAERRQTRRSNVLKSARLIFGTSGAIHNCLVLDESGGGVMVDLGTIIAVPENVTVQFITGPTYEAQRRWAAGTKVGLQFKGGQIISEDTARRMEKITDILRFQGLAPAIATLRMARFFDNQELRRAAEEAEAAYARFEARLEGRLVS